MGFAHLTVSFSTVRSINILEKYGQLLLEYLQDQHCQLTHLRMGAAVDPQPEEMSPFS